MPSLWKNCNHANNMMIYDCTKKVTIPFIVGTTDFILKLYKRLHHSDLIVNLSLNNVC